MARLFMGPTFLFPRSLPGSKPRPITCHTRLISLRAYDDFTVLDVPHNRLRHSATLYETNRCVTRYAMPFTQTDGVKREYAGRKEQKRDYYRRIVNKNFPEATSRGCIEIERHAIGEDLLRMPISQSHRCPGKKQVFPCPFPSRYYLSRVPDRVTEIPRARNDIIRIVNTSRGMYF